MNVDDPDVDGTEPELLTRLVHEPDVLRAALALFRDITPSDLDSALRTWDVMFLSDQVRYTAPQASAADRIDDMRTSPQLVVFYLGLTGHDPHLMRVLVHDPLTAPLAAQQPDLLLAAVAAGFSHAEIQNYQECGTWPPLADIQALAALRR